MFGGWKRLLLWLTVQLKGNQHQRWDEKKDRKLSGSLDLSDFCLKSLLKNTKNSLQCYTNSSLILMQRLRKKAESLGLYFHAALQQKQYFFPLLVARRSHNYVYQEPRPFQREAKQHYLSTIMSFLLHLSLFSSTLNSKRVGSVWS